MSVIVSESPINRHECFRAEITMRDGKPIVALSRWKTTPAGTRRTGQAFEFGARRLSAVAKLLADAGTALDSIASQKGAVSAASAKPMTATNISTKSAPRSNH